LAKMNPKDVRALVIGAGNFGATAAVELAAAGCEVVIIDMNPERLEEVRDRVTQAVVGDGTDRDLLEKFARGVDLAVVSLGDRMDASLLAAHILKEMGVPKIVAKAVSRDHGEILRVLGVREVVFPEREAAKRMVFSLVNPNALDLLEVTDQFNVAEIAVPERFYRRSVRDLNLQAKYGFYVLGVRNALEDKLIAPLSPNYVFRPDDIMVVVGDLSGLERLKD